VGLKEYCRTTSVEIQLPYFQLNLIHPGIHVISLGCHSLQLTLSLLKSFSEAVEAILDAAFFVLNGLDIIIFQFKKFLSLCNFFMQICHYSLCSSHLFFHSIL
jgi:predicted metalloenzyme YecM